MTFAEYLDILKKNHGQSSCRGNEIKKVEEEGGQMIENNNKFGDRSKLKNSKSY